MENPNSATVVAEARINGVKFGLTKSHEICKSSISDCPITHASQLSNPFLGLPLESGKCESCGTSEPGQCEGHFGYIELPTPIYHPDHIAELKKLLSLLCLKCLKLKNQKAKAVGIAERMLSSCCEETSEMTINETKNLDGAFSLELKVPSRSRLRDGFWNFLEKYGFRHGNDYSRPLLPSEVVSILKNLPLETKRKLALKGYYPQDGYILKFLPVPPNCLCVPDISDGIHTMSTDYSVSLLKRVLRQVEIIKNSRSGNPNFESQEIEANDLQAAVSQYLLYRGTGKAARDVDSRFGVKKETNKSSTKAWLEKMKTLFIRKGSGFSSRSVITGEPYKGVSEIGLPYEIAQKITFVERVNQHNLGFLQKLVDEKLCLTYKDGGSMYSLREGSKGHTFLRPGQVVHRRIMDGDIVFINRPPTTHKHSLQALRVYVHDNHTVKINPLMCGPLAADFDGDCIHLFYPQSLEARAEVVELFSVEKQLLSSHTGNFNLQLATDSLLSLKLLLAKHFFRKEAVQQLAMFLVNMLSGPAIVKSKIGPQWTSLQVLQATFPPLFCCSGEKHLISKGEILNLEVNRNVMASVVNDLVTSLFFLKGPVQVLGFFNSIQPLLMENLHAEGLSVSLSDFFVPLEVLESIQENVQKISPELACLYHSYSDSIAVQLDNYLNSLKRPITDFIVSTSAVGLLVDCKSESALNKVIQQIGFVGLQISPKGKFYTETLVKNMSSLFQKNYPSSGDYPTEEFGLVGKPLFRGLNPYQEMVHSISSREVIVRSSRGLTEPGTLFKNLMAILRDVVICYDGTVRNMCSNSIVQFEYGVNSTNVASEFCAGDPVGVLAATAISNPAYKAVLDSSSSSNSSWKMMKEIMLCGVTFKNDISDRRVILYLNYCDCGRKHCQENAALVVQNHMKKVSLRDAATEFLIEYRSEVSYKDTGGLVGHIHLSKMELERSSIHMHKILERCQETKNLWHKKKELGQLFRKIDLSLSESCNFCGSSKNRPYAVPCVQFLWQGICNDALENISRLLAEKVCPVLLQTIIKGDSRVSTVEIVWQTPSMGTWIRSPSKSPKGEIALDIVLEREAVKKSGDAWRVVLDACLPVFHLIDARRSIPYAIKQVEELLGISCTFEQAVQRLYTSVTMVTKGVLKDHLLLLGNNMTCAGTLIGFNAGGIKALSRALDVHAPFMNATLFTPRKCFERAAEKCHVDQLSSIVGSCAWGKEVSLGTGSNFEILWDTRKTELRPQKEIDVYNFLHMVNSSSQHGDTGTSCIGTEIDDLPEDALMDFELSPERDPGLEKLTFEDGPELGVDDNEGVLEPEDGWSSWGKKVASGGSNWSNCKTEHTKWNSNSDSASKSTAEDAGDARWTQKIGTTGIDTRDDVQNAWGKRVSQEVDWKKNPEERTWDKKSNSKESGWGKNANENTWGKKDDFEHEQRDKAAQSSWSLEAEQVNNSDWDQPEEGSWGKKSNVEESSWGKKSENNWGKNLLHKKNGKPNESDWATESDSPAWHGNDSGWGKETPDLARGKVNSDIDWGEKRSWSTTPVESQGDAGVADSKETPADQSAGTEASPGWGSTKNWGQNTRSPSNRWSSGWRQAESSSIDHDSAPSKADDFKDKGPPQWGRGRGRGRGRGWGRGREGRGSSNDGEWKNRRPPHGNDSPVLFTLTRQRLDSFTAEEQDILSETESIMKNVRRILKVTGYNDGDPLSADDETYMVENVLNHHPNKANKLGAGLDYLMISTHPDFPDSRCFFVVAVDGVRLDFSYRKCLESYLRLKYPEGAESFLRKYFREPISRPGWNRNHGTQTDPGTPNVSSTPAREDVGTPSVSYSSTPMLDDAGTPNVSTPALDDAGTPNVSSTPALDDAGTPNVSSTPVLDDAGTPLASTPADENASNT